MHYYDNPKGMIPTWLINWAAKVIQLFSPSSPSVFLVQKRFVHIPAFVLNLSLLHTVSNSPKTSTNPPPPPPPPPHTHTLSLSLSLCVRVSVTDRCAPVPGDDEKGGVGLSRVPGVTQERTGPRENGQHGANEETLWSRGFCNTHRSNSLLTLAYLLTAFLFCNFSKRIIFHAYGWPMRPNVRTHSSQILRCNQKLVAMYIYQHCTYIILNTAIL